MELCLGHSRVIGVVLNAGLCIPAVLLGFVVCISANINVQSPEAILPSDRPLLYKKCSALHVDLRAVLPNL